MDFIRISTFQEKSCKLTQGKVALENLPHWHEIPYNTKYNIWCRSLMNKMYLRIRKTQGRHKEGKKGREIRRELGPLHTRAKSRDHRIVRAQRKVSRGRPNTPQNHVVWSRTLECSVKSYVTQPSTKCYFNVSLFMRGLIHDKSNKSTVVSV
jgi:hypothetical protein